MNGTNGNEPGYPEKALVPYPVIVTLRNIAISGSLFGVFFLVTTYMYDIANWIYIITLVVDMMFAMLKNENYLKDIYIE